MCKMKTSDIGLEVNCTISLNVQYCGQSMTHASVVFITQGPRRDSFSLTPSFFVLDDNGDHEERRRRSWARERQGGRKDGDNKI